MIEPDAVLERALLDLGPVLEVPEVPAGLTESTMARVAQLHLGDRGRSRARTPLRVRIRRIAVSVLALLVALALAAAFSPAVRAAVTDVLRFAGIEVRHEPGPPIGTGVLPSQRTVTLTQARKMAAFTVYVPARLGAPDTVVVSDGTPPRVVSLLYGPGVGRPPAGALGVSARLDEFDGTLEPGFQKFLYGNKTFEPASVGGENAYWISGPHTLVYVDSNGVEQQASARLSANTLIWEHNHLALRLEGDFTKAQAVAVAESMTE